PAADNGVDGPVLSCSKIGCSVTWRSPGLSKAGAPAVFCRQLCASAGQVSGGRLGLVRPAGATLRSFGLSHLRITDNLCYPEFSTQTPRTPPHLPSACRL